MASGHSPAEILQAYPYLEEADLYEALAYAAWQVEEVEMPFLMLGMHFTNRQMMSWTN